MSGLTREVKSSRIESTEHCVAPRHKRAGNLFAAILLAIVLAVPAGLALAEDQDSSIDKALTLSGVSTQLDSLAAAVLMALPSDFFHDTKAREVAITALKKSVNGEVLLEPVREALRKADQPRMVEGVTEFYESRTGRKVARLEARSLAPDLLRTIREGRKTAVSMSETRLNLLRRLIRADKIGATNSDLVELMVHGLLQPPSATPESQEARASQDRHGSGVDIRIDDSRTEELALVAFAHTFRSLDDRELEEYADFKESEAGMRFRTIVLQGVREAVLKLGAALGDSLQERRNP